MDLSSNHEIDVSKAAKSLFKEWKIVCTCIGAGGLMSLLYIFNSKPVYQAEFRIILDTSRDIPLSLLLSESNDKSSILEFVQSSRSDSIENEIEILNSQSVLMPVFKYYKKSIDLDSKSTDSLHFDNWVSSVVIEKNGGTSVLNVRFNTTSKELAVPVAKLISETYQNYSYRGRQKEISSLSRYLKDQINIANEKYLLSSRKSLEYGYTNCTSILGESSSIDTTKYSDNCRNYYRINNDINRAKILLRLEELNLRIKETKKSSNDSVHYGSDLLNSDGSSIYKNVDLIEEKIAGLSSSLNPNKQLITEYTRQRAALVSYINNQILSRLENEVDIARSKLESLDNQKEIMINYWELKQEAIRDEANLISLENQLNQVQLEQARSTKPWQLISLPRLINRPISPVKERILGIGLFLGTLTGAAIALWRRRNDNYIYSILELSELLNCTVIDIPCQKQREKSSYINQLSVAAVMCKGAKRVAIYSPEISDRFDLTELTNDFSRTLGKEFILITTNSITELISYDKRFVFAKSGQIRHKDIMIMNQQLSMLSIKLDGSFFLSHS